jgi:4,5-DOPA dioxygenase extradiol
MAATQEKMPVLFIGHGSPMNALQDNVHTASWRALGARIQRPRAVLAISAHWMTRGSAVTVERAPRTIHDFSGFPPELFAVRYPAPGDPELAREIQGLLAPDPVTLESGWGLDHGTWSVLVHVYPEADIPVVQLSLDATRPATELVPLGRKLAALRRQGVLVVGSGNVVHNLRMMQFGPANAAYPWAGRFEAEVKSRVESRAIESLAAYGDLGPDARLAIPTPEHYLPLLYCLGLLESDDAISFPTEGVMLGSISMLAVAIGLNQSP